jgi:hypothetical protein
MELHCRVNSSRTKRPIRIAAANPTAKADDVDTGVEAIAGEVAQRGGKVVAEHLAGLLLVPQCSDGLGARR